VPQEKMNRLMNMIGELLIQKTAFFTWLTRSILITRFQRWHVTVNNVAFDIARISDELQDANHVSTQLPCAFCFSVIPATIRDTARKVGKQADLIVERGRN
jgi:two-component system chemotaxis sensor kinase CheA